MTILQSALMRGQIQTVRYLLSFAVIRAEATAVNGMSSIMSDVLEINNENDRVPPPPPSPAAAEPSPNPSAKKIKGAKGWKKKLTKCFKYPKQWLEKSRGILMVVATVISTMTFQAVVNPPGGVCPPGGAPGGDCEAGTAVLSYASPYDFRLFIKFNTISFLASVSVTLLLVSGYAFHNRICKWLLSMAMCVTLTFMALTYLQVLYLVVPTVYNDSFINISQICFVLWIGLLVVFSSVMNIIRFLIWMVKKLRTAYFRSKSGLQKIIRRRRDSEENAAAGV